MSRRTPLLAGTLVAATLAIAGAGLAALLVPQRPAERSQPRASAPLRYTGVNLGAGSFGSKRVPAVYGKDYAYPNAREAAPFLAAGMNAVRVPVLWGRLQPAALAPLDAAEMKRLDASLAQLARFELVILDVHSYARYRGTLIADPESGRLLADLWTQLARRYGGYPNIAFGLMNEPHGIDAHAWRAVADQVLAAIRATGARNLVLVPGVRWTGAHSWTAGGEASNAAAFRGFGDPANNFAFEMHQYADGDSSGTGETCVDPERAAARLDAATAWLRANRAKGFLAEFGTAANEGCLAALDAILTRLGEAPDAWTGWTYWAGGGWWGGYPFSIQPDARGAKPQMTVLLRHITERGSERRR